MATRWRQICGGLARYSRHGALPWLAVLAACWACASGGEPESVELGGGQSGVESFVPTPQRAAGLVHCPCDFADSFVVVRGIVLASEPCGSGRRSMIRVDEVLAGAERADIASSDVLRGHELPACEADAAFASGDAVVALYTPTVSADVDEGLPPAEATLRLLADTQTLSLGPGKTLAADAVADLADKAACEVRFPRPQPVDAGSLPELPGFPGAEGGLTPASSGPVDAAGASGEGGEGVCPPIEAWLGDAGAGGDADSGVDP